MQRLTESACVYPKTFSTTAALFWRAVSFPLRTCFQMDYQKRPQPIFRYFIHSPITELQFFCVRFDIHIFWLPWKEKELLCDKKYDATRLIKFSFIISVISRKIWDSCYLWRFGILHLKIPWLVMAFLISFLTVFRNEPSDVVWRLSQTFLLFGIFKRSEFQFSFSANEILQHTYTTWKKHPRFELWIKIYLYQKFCWSKIGST